MTGMVALNKESHKKFLYFSHLHVKMLHIEIIMTEIVI